MGHGEHRDHLVSGRDVTLGVIHVCAEVAVSEHYALRVSGTSGSVVDGGKVVPVVRREHNVIGAESLGIFFESLGIFFGKKLVQVVNCFLNLRVTAEEDLPVVYVENYLEGGHLLRVHLCPAGGVGEKGDTVTMVDKAHYTFRGEIGQNGDDNGFICVDGKVGETPLCTVVGT